MCESDKYRNIIAVRIRCQPINLTVMQLPFVVVNAFVSDGIGGSEAGVVIEDDWEPELATALCRFR